MLDAIQWDTSLIRRYDQAGPRYTSYPTAVQFHEGIGQFDMLHALRDSRKALRPLSLYVHIPFCAHICYYCACNKVITKDRGRAQPYLEKLEREVKIISRHLDRNQVVEQLHLQGVAIVVVQAQLYFAPAAQGQVAGQLAFEARRGQPAQAQGVDQGQAEQPVQGHGKGVITGGGSLRHGGSVGSEKPLNSERS